LDDQDLISVLEKSIDNDHGDLGRTQYLIKRIKKKQVIFKSDKIYLDRLLKFEQTEIPDIDVEFEDTIQTKLQTSFNNNLIKCNDCAKEIEFDEKSIRKNSLWFHENCFQLIDYKKDAAPRRIQDTQARIQDTQARIQDTQARIQDTQARRIQDIQARIQDTQARIQDTQARRIQDTQARKSSKNYTVPEKFVIGKSNNRQTIFTASLLASLVVSVYYLLGDIVASIVGISGTSIFIVTYKSQFKIFNKEKKYFRISTEDNLIKTGIPGFESYLVNGLKKNSSVVLSGSPGSGKTTFGLQFLYSGAKDFDEPGVYITMSQNIDDIKNDCKSFGWDFDDLIQKDKILMIDARPFKIQDETIGKDDSLYRGEQLPFEHLTRLLLNSIKKIKAKRVVIDSVTILTMQYPDKFYMRQGLQGMIQALENYGVTSLIISEFSESHEIPLEWFVTSGIIQLRHTRKEDTMERSIQITKMRGIKHSEQIHPIVLDGDGIHVQHPRLMP
jgi:circadian clock protein KaiC